LFSSEARIDPSPTAGLAEQLKVDGRTRFGATGVAVLRLHAISAWAARVTEGRGVDTAELRV
jgi:hypothetical protein